MDIDKEWKILLTKKDVKHYVKQCAMYLNDKFSNMDKPIVICPILKGAIYFAADLTRKLKFPHKLSFISASSYGDSKTQVEHVKIDFNQKELSKHMIILVDELLDSGKTLYEIKQHIIGNNIASSEDIFTCTLMNKKKSRIYDADYIGIALPDVWLVGYGLDDKKEKRNLENVYACPKDFSIQKTDDDKIFESEEFYFDVLNGLKRK